MIYVLVRKKPETLISLLLYPWKSQTKQSLTPEKILQNCVTKKRYTLKFQDQKASPLFNGFLINPWNFHMLFINTLEKCMLSTPLFVFSSGIIQ